VTRRSVGPAGRLLLVELDLLGGEKRRAPGASWPGVLNSTEAARSLERAGLASVELARPPHGGRPAPVAVRLSDVGRAELARLGRPARAELLLRLALAASRRMNLGARGLGARAAELAAEILRDGPAASSLAGRQRAADARGSDAFVGGLVLDRALARPPGEPARELGCVGIECNAADAVQGAAVQCAFDVLEDVARQVALDTELLLGVGGSVRLRVVDETEDSWPVVADLRQSPGGWPVEVALRSGAGGPSLTRAARDASGLPREEFAALLRRLLDRPGAAR
jgi:hypothetical protein